MNWISYIYGFFSAFFAFCAISFGVSWYMMKHPQLLARRLMGNSRKRKVV